MKWVIVSKRGSGGGGCQEQLQGRDSYSGPGTHSQLGRVIYAARVNVTVTHGSWPSAAVMWGCLPSQPRIAGNVGLGDSHLPARKPRLRKTTGPAQAVIALRAAGPAMSFQGGSHHPAWRPFGDSTVVQGLRGDMD